MDGLVNAVKQKWYGKKLWIFTRKDFDLPDFEDKLLRKSKSGYIVILAISVQSLRNQYGNDSDVIALSQRYAELFSFLKFRLWIRDERHVEYEGPVTKKAFEQFERLNVDLTLDTTATPYNLLDLECYKNTKIVSFTYIDVLREKAAGNPEFADFPLLSIEAFNTLPVRLTSFAPIYTDEEGWDARKLLTVENGSLVYRKAILDLFKATLFDSKSKKSKNSLSICSDPALKIPEPRVGLVVISEGDLENPTQVRGEMLANLLNAHSDSTTFLTATQIKDMARSDHKTIAETIESLLIAGKKDIAIVTHQQLTTGSDIPRLGWILLLDKISSVTRFSQLMGRLTRSYEGKQSVKVYVVQPGMSVTVLKHHIIEAQAQNEGTSVTREMYDLLPLTLYDESTMSSRIVSFEESQSAFDEYLNRVCQGDYKTSYFKEFGLEAVINSAGTPDEILKSTQGLKKNLTDDNESKVRNQITRIRDLSKEIEDLKKPRDKGEKKEVKWLENLRTMMNESLHIGMISDCQNLECVFSTELAREMFKPKNCEFMIECLRFSSDMNRICNAKYQSDMADLNTIPLIDRLEKMFRNEAYKTGMGLVYTPRALIQEMLDSLPDFSDRRSLRFLVPNALDGKIALMLREKYPHAEIICAEYFGFYVGWLKSLGFEVIQLDKEMVIDKKEYNGKKYDLILTNPPYQNTSNSSGNKFWYRFVFRFEPCLTPNGYLAMVTPSSWMTGGNNLGNRGVLKDLFSKNQLVSATVSGVTEKYFPKIGLNISWWVMQNTPNVVPSKIILRDGDMTIQITNQSSFSSNPERLSNQILSKFLDPNQEKFIVHYFHTGFKAGEIEEREHEDEKYSIPHWVQGSDKTNDIYFTYLNHSHYDRLGFRKILIPKGSRYWQPYFDENGVSTAREGFAYEAKSDWNREGVYSVFYSKLYTYICKNLQLDHNGWMKTNIVRSLPKLDMSRVWTDSEIYSHFNLTPDEIAYIEANVK